MTTKFIWVPKSELYHQVSPNIVISCQTMSIRSPSIGPQKIFFNIIFMSGQNGQVTLFWENGWADPENLGIRSKVWMSYALTMDWILHLAPGVPAPAKKVLKKLLQKSAAIYCHCKRRALRVCSFLCVLPARLPWVHQGGGWGIRYHKATCRL